ncbi:MAG: HD-GYP domain-containing protein [Chloroflexi bacterium]|nr:HD-GYP domain-containing protein [Chloroflexota bacterium]
MVAQWVSSRGLVWQFAAVSWVVMAIIGLALANILGNAIESYFIRELMAEANQTLTQRVLRHLTPQDLEQPMSGERYAQFNSWVEDSVLSERTARIKIWNREGMVIYSNDPQQVGQIYPNQEELGKALFGEMSGEMSDLDDQENVGEKEYGRLFEVYVPIVFPGSEEVAGAFEIYQSYEPAAWFISQTQQHVYLGLIGGLGLLYLSLFTIVKRGADTIFRQQSQLELRSRELGEAYQATLQALSSSLDLRDHETEGHAMRVAHRAVELAKILGVSPEELRTIEYGGLLHDVGKIGIPDNVLLKPGPLTAGEWAVIKKHPELGYRIVSEIKFLNGAAEIVRAHHERYDGQGYPLGLKGKEIPLGARIFSVVDTYDAMTSDRPYRKALSHEEAISEIAENAGTQFDPQVVEAFLRLVDQGSLIPAEDFKPEMRVAIPVSL